MTLPYYIVTFKKRLNDVLLGRVRHYAPHIFSRSLLPGRCLVR